MKFFNSRHNQTLLHSTSDQNNGNPSFQTKKEQVFELLRFTLISLCIIIPIRVFIINPFIVSGVSMFPTFHNNDFLIVDRISYKFNNPKRGEVVVFRFPLNPERFFIKRVIGLPGETVSKVGDSVTITSNSGLEKITLTEPYTNNGTEGLLPFTLKENEYFVMGDNREQSSDSRIWGSVPKSLIVGKPLLRLFPFQDLGTLPGEYHYQDPQK